MELLPRGIEATFKHTFEAAPEAPLDCPYKLYTCIVMGILYGFIKADKLPYLNIKYLRLINYVTLIGLYSAIFVFAGNLLKDKWWVLGLVVVCYFYNRIIKSIKKMYTKLHINFNNDSSTCSTGSSNSNCNTNNTNANNTTHTNTRMNPEL
jgi:ACR3 family arsenite efflux pump ArsB